MTTLLPIMGLASFTAPTASETRAAEAAWIGLLASLDAKGSLDGGGYDGTCLLLDGLLADRPGGVSITHALSEGKERPVVIDVDVLRRDVTGRQSVYRGTSCRVILREDEIRKVAEYPADSVSIRVFGRITHLDASARTLEVQSEGTFVASAN